MGKNMKVSTQLAIGFIIIEALLVISLYTGYTTAAQIITVEDPQHYLGSYAKFTAVMFIAMMIISTGVAVTMTRKIRVACADLKVAADALAAGKVDMKLEKRSNDEFGELADDFQKVVDNMRYQAQIAQEVASGNMQVDVKLLSDEDVLGIALKTMIQGNNHAIGSIKESAYQVTTSSSQVASASEALAQGSTEQASAIEQITASIADVATKTKENADMANNAEELILQAIEDVKKGNEEMQQMVVAMQDINKSSESISKIIKVIDDIAFQTNILALNAAVEAARAGEAGKGFAVVAEEVRNLAAKSSSAAAETAELIEDSIQKVEAGSQIANGTAEALEEITKVVQQSEALITEIAEASNYQATAIAQIDQAVEQVSQVVQTNSATSEECAAASMELSNQASRVRDLLSVYKLKEHPQMSMGMGMTGHAYAGSVDRNEQIISLNDSFGKY
ncbi:MAG: methyl-accepting chemotaxis protein [Lachnospiraceae bacterium]|nr:methyl-accepting chemotaxis protein [Lachnospiraceae bacterium]